MCGKGIEVKLKKEWERLESGSTPSRKAAGSAASCCGQEAVLSEGAKFSPVAGTTPAPL